MMSFANRCFSTIERWISTFLIFALVMMMSSCKDEPDAPTKVPRTVLVYMAACNSLGSGGYDDLDLAEMKEAALNGDLNGGRLLVYHADKYGTSKLIEIKSDGEAYDIKEYTDDNSSVSAQRMNDVIEDVKATAPADDYGLVLWSHGNGWLQTGIEDDTFTRHQAFGLDRSKSMNVTTLASVLKNRDFSFIYFDCCYMGTVEVMYELRDVTPIIVASPSEIPVNGMPYDENVKCFFATTPDLIGAATNTFNSYNSLSGSNRTCTISVINTSALDELATATKNLYLNCNPDLPNGRTGIQKFMVESTCWFYDFGDYIDHLRDNGEIDQSFVTAWNSAMLKVVSYGAATPKLWSSLSIDKYSGLSTYVLTSSDDAENKNYNTLSWYNDVASVLFSELGAD